MGRPLTLLVATALVTAGCIGGVVTQVVPVATPRPATLTVDRAKGY